MRRIIYILSIITLSIVSCNKIDEDQHNDNEVTLQYRVSCDALTKSIGTGVAVNYVSYAVYLKIDQDNYELVSSYKPVEFSTGQAICPVVLAMDQTYKIVFVAQHYTDGKPMYQVDFNNEKLTMPTKATANSENYDLFHKVIDIDVYKGKQPEPVTLDRIVAQVNLYCSEENWNEATTSNQPKLSDMTISKIPKNYDLITGEVSGETTVDYAKSTVPAVSVVSGNAHLAYAYCLADGIADVTIKLYKEENDTDPFEITSSEIPVEKNKKTNINGAIIYKNQ